MSDIQIYGGFGFHKPPFTREVRPDEMFRLPLYDNIVQELNSAVEHRMSAAIAAPSGTGKTTLLRRLIDGLPQTRYRVSYIKVTALSKRDFCREVALACGLVARGSIPGLMREIQQNFESIANADGTRSILVLDEAHDLRPDVCTMLRLLTNFDLDSRLLLSLVIAGQLPLGSLLSRADQEAMLHRLAHIDTLRLLSRDELDLYIDHRCAIAGAKNAPFDRGARDAIFEISRGNLRATDRLALKSLQAAARDKYAVVNNAHIVTARKYLWF